MKNGFLFLFVLFATSPLPLFSSSQTVSQVKEEWDASTALTYYYDSREFGTLNILTSAKGLPMNLFFWGFTDFHGDQQSDSGPTDFTRYFMEYRLFKSLDSDWTLGVEGLGVIAEYNDFNGPDNNLARFGL